MTYVVVTQSSYFDIYKIQFKRNDIRLFNERRARLDALF